MAGFFGFGNYQKPGKGVAKQQQEKKRFFQFWDLFLRKFTKMIKLNLLFLLCCIPIVTIGPAFAAMTKIARYYVEEKPVFLLSDFWDAFKENFWQALPVGIFHLAMIYVLWQAFLFYYVQAVNNAFFWILIAIIIIIAFLLLFMSYYIYLIMVSVSLKLMQILKNALMFVFIGIRTNFLTFIFATGVMALSIFGMPLSIPVFLLIGFSMSALITVFNSRPYVYEFLMKPYYDYTGIENPYERPEAEEESVFEDTI